MATEIFISREFPEKLRRQVEIFVNGIAPYVEFYHNGNCGTSRKLAEKLIAVLEKYGIPYKYTSGNKHTPADILIIYRKGVDYSPITREQ